MPAAERRVRTLAPLAHVLSLSLLLLPTLCLMPDERPYLLGALVAMLVLIAGHGALAPVVLRAVAGARRLVLGLVLLGAALPLVFGLCELAVPALRFRLGLPTGPTPLAASLAVSGLLVALALPFWRHELQARAEFE